MFLFFVGGVFNKKKNHYFMCSYSGLKSKYSDEKTTDALNFFMPIIFFPPIIIN